MKKSQVVSQQFLVFAGVFCLFLWLILPVTGLAGGSYGGPDGGLDGQATGSGAGPAGQIEGQAPLPPPTGKVIFSRSESDSNAGGAKSDANAPTGDGNKQAPGLENTDAPLKLQQRPAVVSAEQKAAEEKAAAEAAKARAAESDLASDVERLAVLVTRYDLDVRLVPAENSIAVRARLVVKNVGPVPLNEIPLQVSSSMDWESVRLVGGMTGAASTPTSQNLDVGHPESQRVGESANTKSITPLKFVQQNMATDLDHTGRVHEAVIALPESLAVGGELTLDVIYAGKAAMDATRLTRIGAPTDEAAATDWDGVGTEFIGLRGFGNVVWYPVAAPAAALGDGATVFEAIGRETELEQDAVVGMKVQVEYLGETPNLAVLDGVLSCQMSEVSCQEGQGLSSEAASTPTTQSRYVGHPGSEVDGGVSSSVPQTDAGVIRCQMSDVSCQEDQSRKQSSEAASNPTSQSRDVGHPVSSVADAASEDATVPRIATYELAARRLGFARPSLFVLTRSELRGNGVDVYAMPQHMGAAQGYTTAASLVQPMYKAWFTGVEKRTLSLMDLPSRSGGEDAVPSEPFESGAVTFISLVSADPTKLAPVLVHPLAHAWFESPRVWMSEGFAEFAEMLWVERSEGREVALDRMDTHRAALALVEPEVKKNMPPAIAGQSLIVARDDVYYRTKAAYVWWMLREIVGQKPLVAAMNQYDAAMDTTPNYFEKLVEAASGKKLDWFFDDWVYNDVGLPDLRIVAVTPKQEVAETSTAPGTFVVAVDVANDGAAAAYVPVTGRRGATRVTEWLKVPGYGQATVRLVMAGKPDEIMVNDGSVPEVRATVHRMDVK